MSGNERFFIPYIFKRSPNLDKETFSKRAAMENYQSSGLEDEFKQAFNTPASADLIDGIIDGIMNLTFWH